MAEETLQKMRERLGKVTQAYDRLPDTTRTALTKVVRDELGKDGADFSRIDSGNCVQFFDGCVEVLIQHKAKNQYTEGVSKVVQGGDALALLTALKNSLELGMEETEKAVKTIEGMVNADAATIDASKMAVDLKLGPVKSLMSLSADSQADLLTELKTKMDDWNKNVIDIPRLKDLEKNIMDLPARIKDLEGKAEKNSDALTKRIDALNAKVAGKNKSEELSQATKQIADDHKLVAQIAGAYGALLKATEFFLKQYLACVKTVAGQTNGFVKGITKDDK